MKKNLVKLLISAYCGVLTVLFAGCVSHPEKGVVKMNMINVTPLLKGAEKSTARDLKKMYADKVIDSAVFIFSLVPEGDPTADKAAELAEIYNSYRKELAGCDLPVGILLQSTIGHGWKPNEESKFSRFRPYDGQNPYMFCPLDEQFRKHICDQVRKTAALDADFFMLDDDFRMYTARLGGCYCPLHLQKFNAENRTNYDAASLYAAIQKDDALARRWDQCQLEPLLIMAKEIRQAVSAEKPDLPGSFCACAGDIRHAVKIAGVLAAPGQKPMIRINNARYMNDSPKTWPAWTQKTAYQIAAIPENFTILAETDTFPHNRYSTSGSVLHSLYSWSLLAGCEGGKLWITATGISNDGSSSGAYYRKMLRKYRNFYQEIADMQPEYLGLAEVLPQQVPFNLVSHPNGIRLNSWGTALLGFAGIPFSYEKNPSKERVVLLSDGVENFSDAELKKFFSGTVLINGDAAKILTRRGFAGYMGISAKEWDAPKASFEKCNSGEILSRMPETALLTDPAPGAEVLSTLYHSVTRNSPAVSIAPGAVRFRNHSGGTVITVASCFSPPGYQAYGMLNEARRKFIMQLVDCGITYAGDAPLHLTLFKDRGILTLCAVNLGLDMLEDLPLSALPDGISTAKMLQPDGSWQEIPLAGNTLKFPLPPMQIAFIRLQ